MNRFLHSLWALVFMWIAFAPSAAQWSSPELVWRDPAGISGYTTVAADEEGTYILINTYQPNASTATSPDDVLLTHRTDTGWSAPVNVSRSPEQSQFLALAAGTDGAVHAAWLEWRDPQRPANATDLLYVSSTGTIVSEPRALIHTVEDTLGAPGFDRGPIYLRSQASGSLHLVFQMYFLDGAYVMHLRGEGGRWAEPQRIGEEGGYYAYLSQAPEGKLFVTYLSFDPVARRRVIVLISSEDDGRIWSVPVTVAQTPSEERDFAPRVAATPQGRIHVAWRHSTDSGLFADVILHTYSDDGGATWSTIEEVKPPAEGEFFGIEALADSLGRFHLFYLWKPNLLSSVGRLYHTVRSEDRWSTPERLFGTNSVTFSDRNPGLAVDARGHVHATWTQNSTRGNEVYYASADLTTLGAPAGPIERNLLFNYPNPFRNATTVGFTLAAPGDARLLLYTLNGRLAAEQDLGQRPAGSQTATLNGNALPSGVYFYEVRAADQVQRGRLTVLR